MPFGEESTRAFIADYYKLQWERIVHHEDQRIRFSSMIAAASVAGIGIIVKFTSETNLGNLIVACVVLSAANILAIIFCRKSRRWIKYHQKKAKLLAKELEPGLSDVLEIVDKPNSNDDFFRREQIFNYLHGLFVLAAIALVIIKIF